MAAPNAVETGAQVPAPKAVPAHRTDLDGLRGLAIMLVACFHIWFGRVSGGVDVFLALSGYFFLGSLLRHAIGAHAPRVSLGATLNPWPRLSRLLRRLLPALFTMLLAVTVLTVLIFPQTRWVNVGREVIASALYYQNWYLAWNSQDYLAASSANSPLQHVWSMAVQGQFFLVTLVTALALAGLLKVGARVLAPLARPTVIRTIIGATVLAVAAASFAWAQHRMAINQPFNYFDTFARVWEPLAGGLLAIWLPTMRVHRMVRNVVTVAALALIVSCGWWIDGVDEYPGPMALVPVGATLAIIWAGAVAQETSRPGEGPRPMPEVNRLLAGRWPVWVGSIAYSLYLWHWPLLIFYLSWRGADEAGVLEGVGLLAVSIALAWLTKRYVEDPLRGGAGPRHASRRVAWLSYRAVVSAVLVLLTMVAGVGIKAWEHHVSATVVDTRDLDPAVYPGARAFLHGVPVPAVAPQPSPLKVLHDYPETSTDGFMSDFTDGEIHVGTYGAPNGSKTIALVGGSHSEMWITALNIIGKRNDFTVKTYLKMGCPLSTDPEPKQRGVPYPQCYEWGQRVVKRVLEDRPDAVFTTSTRPHDTAFGDWVPPDYLPIFDTFLDAGIPIFGMRDTPWPHNSHGGIDTPTCLADGGSATDCATRRVSALLDVDPARAVAATRPLFHPLDVSDGVCQRPGSVPDPLCPAIIGNIIVYKDWHHLSATYVRSLTDEVERQMGLALDWAGR
ncbi:acyltransferase family protein [Gordonia sp. (in: high G+C Gram-positive bacteria)]|nr:acyltransferase family protein [Gordonia sp. (in: high G+C Gram-positive bacteria)]